jgi:hypothetical protein
VFEDLREIVSNNYLVEDNDTATEAYTDLLLRCLVCNKKLELLDQAIEEKGTGFYRLKGTLVGGEQITFDDGTTAFLCHNCITGEKDD